MNSKPNDNRPKFVIELLELREIETLKRNGDRPLSLVLEAVLDQEERIQQQAERQNKWARMLLALAARCGYSKHELLDAAVEEAVASELAGQPLRSALGEGGSDDC